MPWDEAGGPNSCSSWGHNGLDAHSTFIAINRDDTEQAPGGFYTHTHFPSSILPAQLSQQAPPMGMTNSSRLLHGPQFASPFLKKFQYPVKLQDTH